MSVTSTFQVLMQLAGTAGAWTDVTADVVTAAGIHAFQGNKNNDPNTRVAETGALTFTLDNSANNSAGAVGYYSPGHNSCRSGFQAGITVLLNIVYDNRTYPMFYGRIPVGGIRINPGIYGERKVEVEVRDLMELFAIHDINLPALAENKRIDEMVPLVVANMPIQPLSTTYNTGSETFTTVFDNTGAQTKAMTELQKAAMSEMGYVYTIPDSTYYERLVVEGRMKRTNTPAMTSVPVITADSGAILVNEVTEPIQNPGFETAGTGGTDLFANWIEHNTAGTITDETTLVHSGGHACKIVKGTASSGEIYQNITGVPGESRTLTFWTRGDGTNQGQYYIYDNTNKAYIVGSTQTGVTGTVYTQVTKTFTVPAGCTSVSIELKTSAVNYGTAYFDDVSVAYVTPTTSYLTQEDGTSHILLDETQTVDMQDKQRSIEVLNGANVFNVVRARSYPRKIDTSATVLFTLDSPISIAAGETKTGYQVSYTDPQNQAENVGGKNMISPVATTDYLMNTSEAGTGTDLTGNLSISVSYAANGAAYTLTNSATSSAYITKLQARGYGVYTYNEVEYQVSDSTSKGIHGAQSLELDMQYQDDPTVAAAFGDTLLNHYKNPKTEAMSVNFFANTDEARMLTFLHTNIGAKVALQESVSGINGDYFVIGRDFTVHPGNAIDFTWYTKRAEVDIYKFWYLDTAGSSELDTTTYVGF